MESSLFLLNEINFPLPFVGGQPFVFVAAFYDPRAAVEICQQERVSQVQGLKPQAPKPHKVHLKSQPTMGIGMRMRMRKGTPSWRSAWHSSAKWLLLLWLSHLIIRHNSLRQIKLLRGSTGAWARCRNCLLIRIYGSDAAPLRFYLCYSSSSLFFSEI